MGWMFYAYCNGGCNQETPHGDQPSVAYWMKVNGWVETNTATRCPACITKDESARRSKV